MQVRRKVNGGTPLGGSLEPLPIVPSRQPNSDEPDCGSGPCLAALRDLCLRIASVGNIDSPGDRHQREAMKPLLTTCIALSCLSLSFAQGLQGKVTLSGNTSVKVSGHSVALTWNASQNATSYNVYRGSTHGGPYVKVPSGVFGTAFTDVRVTHNQTLYYVTTAVNGSSESGYSNEATATVP
jgi:fibronectin type 3 domain-containing protein